MDGRSLVADWVTMISTGVGDADAIVSEAFVEHAVAPFGTEAPGRVNGPAHLREASAWLRAQYPDLHMAVEAVAADGEVAAVLVRSSGTNDGPLNGRMPATHRRFDASQTHWFRIDGGLLAEHWATRDDLTTMLQLGVVARPAGPDAR